jgi:Tol biopolymer transport system component
MPESWVEELLAAAPPPTPEFRERLRQDVIASWRREPLTMLSPPQRGGRRWALLLAAAVVAALIAGLVAATATGLLGDDRPADEPPPAPPTSRPSATTPAGMIAFVGGDDLPSCTRARPCGPDFIEPDDIYVVRADGSGLKAVTSSPDDMVYAPAWSPTGNRLAYLRFTRWGPDVSGGDFQLVIIDPSTSQETLSVEYSSKHNKTPWTLLSSLEWSPDGRWIVVDMVAGPRAAPFSFSIVDVETGEITTISGYHGLRWSADGRWMALYGYDEVLVVPTADVDVSDLSDDAASLAGASNFPVEGSLLEMTAPDWAPDGSAFAVTVDAGGWDPHVEVISVADGTRRTVADPALSPAWSPDGRHIAYLDRVERAWVTGVDGTDTRQVGRSLIAPVWSPDSSSLVLVDEEGLYSINLDTNNETRLSPPELGPSSDQVQWLTGENVSRWNGVSGDFGPDWHAVPQTTSEKDSSSNG